LPQLQAQLAFFAGVDPASPLGQEKRVEWWLGSEFPTGAGVEAVSKAVLLPPANVCAVLGRLVQNGLVRQLTEDHFIQAKAYQARRGEVEARIRAASGLNQTLSLALGELRAGLGWPAALWNQVEVELEQANLIQRSGAKLVLPGAVAQLASADQALLERIVNVYEQTGFQSPRAEELPALMSAAAERVQRLLEHLFTTRRLVRLSPLVVLSCGHLRKAQALVVNIIREKGVLNSADFKLHLNTSRKYALAILDHLDALRITVRDGNDRRLAADYQKHLV
jgi:selenocysteine-specific elongation factor